jgi:NAD(P) transhydrogenase subunit alpha
VDLLTELTIFALAVFVGFEVISKVPNTLHTPLMSHVGHERDPRDRPARRAPRLAVTAGDTLGRVLAVVAVAFGTINIVGGLLVPDRMLETLRKKPERSS